MTSLPLLPNTRLCAPEPSDLCHDLRMKSRVGFTAAVVAVLSAALARCLSNGESQTNAHPMSQADYAKAKTELTRLMEDLEVPSKDVIGNSGRLVGAAAIEGGAIVITQAVSDKGVCLQAKVYGQPATAYARVKTRQVAARTEVPAASGCDWFLRHPDVDLSSTEITDFGAGHIVFGEADDAKPWPTDLTALREEMVDIISDLDASSERVPPQKLGSYELFSHNGSICLKGTLPSGKSLWWISDDDEFLRTAEEASDRLACRS